MILLFGAEKGGVGKSTMAINMAAIRAAQGRDVLLVDTDRQGSSQQWASIRMEEGHMPAIACVSLYGKTLTDQVRAMIGKYDDIVIDAGGRDSVELRAAMMVADVLVTPSMPSQFDIFSLSTMDRLVGEAQAFNTKLQAYILVNGAPTNPAQTDADDMREYLSEMKNYFTLTSTIKARKAYRRCARDGLAATELSAADEKAAAEMMALAAEVWK
jgi:chromosome partitioning protein